MTQLEATGIFTNSRWVRFGKRAHRRGVLEWFWGRFVPFLTVPEIPWALKCYEPVGHGNATWGRGAGCRNRQRRLTDSARQVSMTDKGDVRRTTSRAKADGYICRWELGGDACAENISPLLVWCRAYSEPIGREE